MVFGRICVVAQREGDVCGFLKAVLAGILGNLLVFRACLSKTICFYGFRGIEEVNEYLFLLVYLSFFLKLAQLLIGSFKLNARQRMISGPLLLISQFREIPIKLIVLT